MQVLRRIPQLKDPRLLVGAATGDDAGVYRIDRDRALVQTVDFFTPIVDDPYVYGQIAAANALSDVYAMGGRPLTALNVVGMPVDRMSTAMVRAVLRGGAAKVKEAGCVLAGGHSIKTPEPIYGLAVTVVVSPRRMITNAAARAGDWLVLTKPLGTGIVSTAIKRGLASAGLARRAERWMRRLNAEGHEVARRGWVRAGTDVTGFGLLGHLGALCRASGVGAEVASAAVPMISPEVGALIRHGCVPGGTIENLKAAGAWTEWCGVPEEQRRLLADAQTSGGLLLCVAPGRLEVVRRYLRSQRCACVVVIGRIVKSSRPVIRVTAAS